MNKLHATLCAALLALGMGSARADMAPGQVTTALTAIESAKALARTGRGSLLMVGSLLSSNEDAQDNEVVVLDYPTLRDMKPGMVLILAKVGCEPIDACLIARRVTDMDPKNGLQTEPYNGAEGLLFGQIKATLLGSVAFAVDLGTGAIRDMRATGVQQLTLDQAIAAEEARTRVASSQNGSNGGS